MQTCWNFLIGKTLDEFRCYAQEANIPFRITAQEGHPMMITADYNPYRINATVVGDVVTNVQAG